MMAAIATNAPEFSRCKLIGTWSVPMTSSAVTVAAICSATAIRMNRRRRRRPSTRSLPQSRTVCASASNASRITAPRTSTPTSQCEVKPAPRRWASGQTTRPSQTSACQGLSRKESSNIAWANSQKMAALPVQSIRTGANQTGGSCGPGDEQTA